MNGGEQHKPCDIVLGAARPSTRRVAVFAGIAAAALHLGGAAVAVALGSSAEKPVRRESPPLVVIDHVIDLNPPTLPEPEAPPTPPAVEPPAPPPRARQKAAPVAREIEPIATPQAEQVPPEAPEPDKAPSEPPPVAQAGQLVTAANNPESAPAFAVASGTASSFAGGTSAASGTGTNANHTGQAGSGTGDGYSKARPPQLHSRNWPCGWPSEADDLEFDEAFVTVRATIRADGSVEEVELLSDPGHGFGKRAALCARSKVSFEPALDASGRPSAGKTPPMRIRFVRSEE